MTTKHHERKPSATEKSRGGGQREAKASHKQHRTSSTVDDALDEALDESFPASDPPAQTQPMTHVGTQKKQEKKPN